MLKNWLKRFYQDTGMSGLCGKAIFLGAAKGVDIPMSIFLLNACLLSLKTLLFMHMKRGFFKDYFILQIDGMTEKERVVRETESWSHHGQQK